MSCWIFIDVDFLIIIIKKQIQNIRFHTVCICLRQLHLFNVTIYTKSGQGLLVQDQNLRIVTFWRETTRVATLNLKFPTQQTTLSHYHDDAKVETGEFRKLSAQSKIDCRQRLCRN